MRLVLLVLVAVFASGCFVFDEIDKGMEIMEAHTPLVNKKKRAEEEKAKLAKGEKPPTYAETVGGWFENAKTLSPRGTSSSGTSLVKCTAQGKVLFTKRADCLARGGRPG